MQAMKRMSAILLTVLLSVPALLAQEPQRNNPGNTVAQDVQIILQPQQVRFTTQKAVEEMQLQIFDQSGELVYDSLALPVNQLTWLWQSADGRPVKSGLYAYTLSIKEAGAQTARVRRGHFIVDRAGERDGQTDRVWITSQDDTGIGTELTVAKNDAAVIAGTRTLSDRSSLSGRGTARTVEEQEKSAKSSTETVSAALAGTVGRLAKFITATEVGDSLISESGGSVQLPNGVQLGVGAQGNQVQFGSPNSETGMTISGATGRSDLRFDGTTLKLVAGPAGSIPLATNGVAINTVGNVGIGTLTPQSKLVVNAGGRGGEIQLGTPGGESGMAIIGSNRADVRFDGSTLKLLAGTGSGAMAPTNGINIDRAGNVGIGTVNPATKLHVEGIGSVEATIKSNNERAALVLSNGLSSAIQYVWTLESGLFGNVNLFGIYNRNAQKAGLQINGDLLVSVKALQILGGADFAENFDVRADNNAGSATASEIQPGMVVAIDPNQPGKLTLSRRAYDRRVAGIISGAGDVKPGMMMGQAGTLADGKHPVALSGRVYCWVDATRGAVKPGDLLTTSATPGHAMKVNVAARAQGAIIGKAMTGLKAGKGLVLVLVTLQ